MPQSELNSILDIDRAIKQIDNQISEIDRQRSVLMTERKQLYENRQQLTTMNDVSTPVENVSHYSSQNEKIALFRSLFRGREDVFPRRFESVKTQKSGYVPCCKHEWVKGICQKPAVKCNKCSYRELLPVTDDIIRFHLMGHSEKERKSKDFTIGVYPLLPDETCWFLAADFDKDTMAKRCPGIS
jgi:hypothetical protein